MLSLHRKLCLTLALFVVPLTAYAAEQPQLEVFAEMQGRPGNIAVALDGSLIMTMHPFDDPLHKVMKITNGKLAPFPNDKWSESRPAGAVEKDDVGIESAIGIHATIRNIAYTIDMGSKNHAPRLVGFSIPGNTVFKVQNIPENVLTEQSFLQDFAFDWIDNTTYIADMGQADLTKPAKPALIVLYSNPFQKARRVLEGHPGVLPTDAPMRAEGKDIQVMQEGKPVAVHAALNPITIDPQRGWLYFGPMGPGKLYRVKTSLLKDINLPPEQLAAAVEEVADKPASDGMTIDAQGNIYLGNVDAGEIDVIRNGSKTAEPYIQDERLKWVDGFSFSPDGYIYATVNQLNRSKQLNLGKETSEKPYLIVRFKPIAMGSVGR